MLSKLSIVPPDDYECTDPHTGSEEFDFSEVFGSLPSPHHPLASITETEAGSDSLPTWCYAELAAGRKPAMICTRSHSFVGPSPRPSIVRQASLQSWDDSHGLKSFDALRLAKQGGAVVSVSPPRISFSGSDEDGDGEESGADLSFQGSLESILSGLDSSTQADDEKNTTKLGPQDFKLLRVVGQGAFGKVFQVQQIETEDIFAMKVMRKDTIMEKNHGEYMKAERDILTKIVHPFIVQLRYSFQTKSKLYLILDFINGGHLFFQLYRQGTFSEELARVYTAEIVSAVTHLHKNGIIHRDLKPENILLDAEGHVKLTDFGLAKEIDESKPANSLCGTVEYMAPEIVLAKGHGKAADWWSVGILLFEMLTGQPPFTHNNRQKLQQKIAKDKIKLPSYLTSEAHSLLKGLLQKEACKRLGSGASGSDAIKQHKWFKQINWRKLDAREIVPKFRPAVNGQDCIANFDEKWTKLPAQDSPASTPKSHGDMGVFEGYTYVAPNPWLTLLDKTSKP
ncbi:hypothetical protein GOP47_0007475 [Adiantum capillus-veneris]|uniref:non-specific serine/threonine protein kinase n=1 Tax=Adiantum capillus-veneris TaxID=13818 RepID=A0A9D4ZLJ9_ADICA|nr:hypothetical protein GOP47_0007475 [Adiantum capillus-veneris]